MKTLPFLALFFIITSIYAQDRPHGQWSLMGNLNYADGISEAMNGSISEFENDIRQDYNNSRYPFGDERSYLIGWSGQLAYRFPGSPLSLYLADEFTLAYASNGFERNTTFSSNAIMSINMIIIGSEYTFGKLIDQWGAFGRLGIAASFISGKVEYYGWETDVPMATRFGFTLEAGGRYNIAATPLALELSGNYTNANLIGKSYTKPEQQPPSYLEERELNDGANPDDPNDHDRVIDFISMRLGLRIWF